MWVKLFTPPVESKWTRGAEDLDVGDTLVVQLTDLDIYQGYIDFVRIP